MSPPASSPAALSILFIFLLAAAPSASAPGLHLSIERLERGKLIAEGITVEVALDDADGVGLRVHADRLQLGGGVKFNDVEIRCADGRLDDNGASCPDGSFRANSEAEGLVEARVSFLHDVPGGETGISFAPFSFGGADVEGAVHFSGSSWFVEFAGENVKLPLLRAILAPLGFWPKGHSDESGSLDVALRALGSGESLQSVEGIVRGRSLGFLGPNSAENLDLESDFEVSARSGWALRGSARLLKGSLYLEPGMEIGGYKPGFALEPGAAPIRVDLDLHWDPAKERLLLEKLDLLHPGVVEIHGGATLELNDLSVIAAAFKVATPNAGALYTTWLQPLLLESTLSELETTGTLEADVKIENDGLRELDLRLGDLHAYDGGERFSIAGLSGTLRVTAGSEPVISDLGWQGLGVYKLMFGPGEMALASGGGALALTRWQDVPLLDGSLHVDSLAVTDTGRPGMRVLLDGSVTPVSMSDLTQALGWPVMSGTVQGGIRGLNYSGGLLRVAGEINVGLFDGSVTVRNLRIEDLFGSVPRLFADVDINNIDLGLLTDRFSFGSIEGRLGGSIRSLELHAWEPVYFEAMLATPEDDDSRHRISRRAVSNLGFIGGGSMGALSGGMLRFFDEYSYGRLGVSCRLNNGSCQLGGVEETPDGFLLLTRGGLLPPWIEVKGSGRSISWTDLVEGLKTITTNSPEIR